MGRIYFISTTFLLGVCSNVFSGCSAEQNFLVWRTVNSTANEYWHSSRDKFTIPDSVCKNTSIVNPCFLYDSFTTGKTCDCKCPYLKPSFRFYNGDLRCMDDAVMRKTEECGFFWRGLAKRDEMPFFSPQSKQSNENPTIEVNAQREACEVDEAASSYLTCDGEWKAIKNGDRKSRFKMMYISLSQKLETYELQINASSGTPDIRGRIIKLVLTCRPPQKLPCILLKVTGNVQCEVGRLKSTSFIPSTTSLPSTVFTNIKTLKTEEKSPGVKGGNQENQKPEKSQTNIVAIATGVGAASALILVVLVVLLCLRKRSSCKRDTKSLQSCSSHVDEERKAQDKIQKPEDDLVVPNPIYEETGTELEAVHGNYFSELKKKQMARGGQSINYQQQQDDQGSEKPEQTTGYDDEFDYYEDDEWESFSEAEGKDDGNDIYHNPNTTVKSRKKTLKNCKSPKSSKPEAIYINVKERD